MSKRLLILAVLFASATASAQQPGVRRVSLEEAIALADRSSETIAIARAGVTRAN